MAHDLLKGSVQAQTHRAGMLIVGILVGGVLVLLSYVSDWVFGSYTFETDGKTLNFYSDALALAGALLLGLPIIIHAAKGLLEGHMHMDELVALAVVAAIAAIDYKAAGAVAFFLLLANLVETRTALGARASIESLVRLAPKKAHLLRDGQETLVDPLTLSPGDVVRVRPGDNVPADGVIVSGLTSINQANITGESLPVDKSAGDEVFSGTSNLEGSVEVRVTRAGKDTTLGKVQHLILQAEGSRIPIMRLIDRYAGWYTPVILMLAGAVLFFNHKNPGAMANAVTMLVVACPCSLILAVPTAMVAALSCAARLGILIKDVGSLEVARTLTAFVFDKTGTLTTGELSVTQVRPAPASSGAELSPEQAKQAAAELLSAAGSVEHHSRHPVARAVVATARRANVPLGEARDFQEVSGRGAQAIVDGQLVMVGRASWLKECGIDFSAMAGARYAEPEGLSTLYVVRGGRLLGWVGLEDRTRQEARQALDDLRACGINELVMVTGDRWSVARRVAADLGATEVQAEVLPAHKLELVSALRKQGHRVAVVGDGVNDAPALAAGDLSIAMGAAGSDVAINSATIALMNNDLKRLAFLVRLSRRTTRVIHQNLLFGVVFVVAFLILAALGVLSPVMGAALHMVAATFVIFNSARLVRFGEELHTPPARQGQPAKRAEPVAAAARA
jgi:Cd2+/Zn2+-exporting ATPase